MGGGGGGGGMLVLFTMRLFSLFFFYFLTFCLSAFALFERIKHKDIQYLLLNISSAHLSFDLEC